MQKREQSYGFTTVSTVVAVIFVVLIAGTGVYVWKHNDKSAASKNTDSSSKSVKKTPSGVEPVDPYVGWQQYSNQTYGITFKYPAEWAVEEVPGTSPSDTDPTEFAANLKFNVSEKYSESAVFVVHSSSLSAMEKLYDGDYAQSSQNVVDKKSLTLKGKQALSYSVTNSGIQSKRYLFNAGTKTYEFSSINEELNQQRSGNYWTDFDKVFSSLTIK